MDKAGRQWQAVASHERLQRRARLLKGIRAFFDARGVLEVETPLLSPTATTDPHIDSLQCRFRGRPYYLNTSPEYAMKRLLAAGAGAIYQVCKAFRDDVPGALHNPEFSLLEWYRPGFDMHRLMQELQALLAQCWQQSTTGTGFPGVNTVSYQQAFEQSIGLNPHTANAAQCYHSALAHNIEIPQGLGEKDPVNDWLDWFMLSVIAPGFGKNGFTFLYDYPASQCSLARLDRNEQGHTVAKRFELFYGEIELANGFDELTDADEQRRRFMQENRQREQAGQAVLPIDERFLAALESGLGQCSGVALGLDRLLMVLSGAEHIEQVLALAWEDQQATGNL